jgi:hypothetical protein
MDLRVTGHHLGLYIWIICGIHLLLQFDRDGVVWVKGKGKRERGN